MAPDALDEFLPWRYPFRMVDALESCTPHEQIVTRKQVSAGDPLARGASASGRVLPDALVLEGMGQSASLLHQLSYSRLDPSDLPMLGYLKATWHRPARAGDAIEFSVRSVKMTSTMGIFQAVARVGGEPIAEAEFAMGVSRGSSTHAPGEPE